MSKNKERLLVAVDDVVDKRLVLGSSLLSKEEEEYKEDIGTPLIGTPPERFRADLAGKRKAVVLLVKTTAIKDDTSVVWNKHLRK